MGDFSNFGEDEENCTISAQRLNTHMHAFTLMYDRQKCTEAAVSSTHHLKFIFLWRKLSAKEITHFVTLLLKTKWHPLFILETRKEEDIILATEYLPLVLCLR